MSAALNPAAEAARLRKTIALADEAIRCAAGHRSAEHAEGETIEETRIRWTEAGNIEAAAKDCRKAARSALAGLKVFPDLWSAEKVAAKIEVARVYALGLKTIIDEAQRANANRQIRVMARMMAAAAEAGVRAQIAAAARKGGVL
jgi:hypothetical protein